MPFPLTFRRYSPRWPPKPEISKAALWDSMDIEGRDLFTSKGGQMINLSDAEAERWIKAVEPVIGSYKKKMACQRI